MSAMFPFLDRPKSYAAYVSAKHDHPYWVGLLSGSLVDGEALRDYMVERGYTDDPAIDWALVNRQLDAPDVGVVTKNYPIRY